MASAKSNSEKYFKVDGDSVGGWESGKFKPQKEMEEKLKVILKN